MIDNIFLTGLGKFLFQEVSENQFVVESLLKIVSIVHRHEAILSQ